MPENLEQEIVIRPLGLRTMSFEDPQQPGNLVRVKFDAFQLAEAFYLIDEQFPLAAGDPEAPGRRRDALRAAISQLLDDPENPLPLLTDDMVYQVRMATYAAAYDVKKKMGIPDGEEAGPTRSPTGNSSSPASTT